MRARLWSWIVLDHGSWRFYMNAAVGAQNVSATPPPPPPVPLFSLHLLGLVLSLRSCAVLSFYRFFFFVPLLVACLFLSTLAADPRRSKKDR